MIKDSAHLDLSFIFFSFNSYLLENCEVFYWRSRSLHSQVHKQKKKKAFYCLSLFFTWNINYIIIKYYATIWREHGLIMEETELKELIYYIIIW